jgi:hypothetical protein
MPTATDTVLEMENASDASVRCSRCGETIGRIQVRPPEELDPYEWEERVQGELDVLVEEHMLDCPRTEPRDLAPPPPVPIGERREKP